MKIRMTIAVPIDYLSTLVKTFDKNGIKMTGTSFVGGNGFSKTKKFLTSDERKSVAQIKDRSRGRAVVVSRDFGVTPGVIRGIWRE